MFTIFGLTLPIAGLKVGYQSLFVRLPDTIARRVRALLEASDAGYASLDEFAEVAFVNQLNAEGAIAIAVGDSGARPPRHLHISKTGRKEPPGIITVDSEPKNLSLMRVPPVESPLPLAAPPESGDNRLFVLTNRLSQLKVAVRVCANQANLGSWPEFKKFQRHASETARMVGVALKTRESAEALAKGPPIRWSIGYPTGEDAPKAMIRFSNSFTIGFSEKGATGPMAVLGLANLVDGRVVLTDIGWRLAATPAALMAEAPGRLLSNEEATILRNQLRAAPAEAGEIREFLGHVKRSHGSQRKVDDLLNQHHPEWNRDYVIAHRAAMAGRLSDVDVLKVNGRGRDATIELLPPATEFDNINSRKS